MAGHHDNVARKREIQKPFEVISSRCAVPPDGMTYRWRPAEGGGMRITARPNSYWTDPSRDDGRVYRELYWAPTVLIRAGIAVVWAPYEFRVDGETSHCGVDVFDFVRMDGEWLVSNAMWTVEPGACAELRPADPSSLRP